MRDRHDIHIANDVNSVLGMIFAGGPAGVLGVFGLITLAALSLQALAEPGIAFAGAGILILPFVALRVGRARSYRGRLIPARLAIAGVLLLGAVACYQLQWGALGKRIEESRADTCFFNNLYGYGRTSGATSWFLSCRSHFSREQMRQGCTRLLSGEDSRTLRLRVYCD